MNLLNTYKGFYLIDKLLNNTKNGVIVAVYQTLKDNEYWEDGVLSLHSNLSSAVSYIDNVMSDANELTNIIYNVSELLIYFGNERYKLTVLGVNS